MDAEKIKQLEDAVASAEAGSLGTVLIRCSHLRDLLAIAKAADKRPVEMGLPIDADEYFGKPLAVIRNQSGDPTQLAPDQIAKLIHP